MKKYNIVYADPAWSFGDKLRSSKKLENGNMHFRELELHYNTMKTSEICALPVKEIVADDAVLPTFPVVSPFSRYVSLNLVVSDTRSISVTN